MMKALPQTFTTELESMKFFELFKSYVNRYISDLLDIKKYDMMSEDED